MAEPTILVVDDEPKYVYIVKLKPIRKTASICRGVAPIYKDRIVVPGRNFWRNVDPRSDCKIATGRAGYLSELREAQPGIVRLRLSVLVGVPETRGLAELARYRRDIDTRTAELGGGIVRRG